MPDPVRPAFATFFSRLLLSRPNHPNRLNALARETPTMGDATPHRGAETPQSRRTRRPRTGSQFTATTLGATIVATTLTGSRHRGRPHAVRPCCDPATPGLRLDRLSDSNSVPEVAANADLFSDVSKFQFSDRRHHDRSLEHRLGGATDVGSGNDPVARRAGNDHVRRRHRPGGMSWMMSKPATRVQREQALLALAQKYGANGIDLDFEDMAFNTTSALVDPTRAGFDALVHELAVALHKRGMMLAVNVVSKTSEPGTSMAQQVYDYPTLGKWADRFRIMTYDQHWSGGSPGAIAGMSWTDSVISFAASAMTSSKVFMGVPLYGYDWGTPGNRAAAVTYQGALNLMAQYHVARQWSATEDAPYFTYTDAAGVGHTVWYNDAQAIAAKLPLVGKYGLGGVAFWSLGGEDPAIWPLVQSFTFGSNPFGNTDFARSSPGGIEIAGWSIDANTSSPIAVAIYADGHLMGNVAAGDLRSDVANVYGFFGDHHGFDVLIPLPPGPHTLCAYGLNVGAGNANTALGCHSATALSGDPYGYLDSVSAVPGGFAAHGWDIDPDTARPVQTHVYVDGHLAGIVSAADSRPDVASYHPLYGSAHGYTAVLPATNGTHTVCTYAINVGFGSTNTKLGCKTVTVMAGNPFGHLDGVTTAGHLWGWAIDPDTAKPIPVDLYADGKLLAEIPANEPRADVRSVYPAYGAFHGFHADLTLTAGSHVVCAYAINTAAGNANTPLGCNTVAVPAANPVGHLDVVRPWASGQALVSGWAYDANANADAGVNVPVTVTVDNAAAGQTQTGLVRTDVAQVFPQYGRWTGFQVVIDAAAGQHTVCATAVNVGPGTGNTNLGCQTVTLP